MRGTISPKRRPTAKPTGDSLNNKASASHLLRSQSDPRATSLHHRSVGADACEFWCFAFALLCGAGYVLAWLDGVLVVVSWVIYVLYASYILCQEGRAKVAGENSGVLQPTLLLLLSVRHQHLLLEVCSHSMSVVLMEPLYRYEGSLVHSSARCLV